MFKNLFSKTDSYWLCLILTTILCFGFAITHSSIGIDDEALDLYTKFPTMLNNNRIGYILTANIISTLEFLPFWREFAALVLLVIGITIHVNNFIKNSPDSLGSDSIYKFNKTEAIIFSCLAISFPYFAFHFIFMVTCLEHGLLAVLTGLAVDNIFKYFNSNKEIKYIVLTFLFCFLSVSIYESSILYFIISVLFISIINIAADCKKNKQYIILFCNVLFVSFTAFIINDLILFLFMKNQNLLKIKSFNCYDFSSFMSFFSSAVSNITEFLKGFVLTLSYNFGSVTLVLSAGIFISLVLYLSIKKKNIIIFIIGLIVLLLPFTPIIVTGNYLMPYRVYSIYSFVNALTFVLLYMCIKKYKLLSEILLVIIFLIIFQQSKEMNQIFYAEHLKCENDKLFAYSIMQDLYKLNLQNKPVFFIGVRENPNIKYIYNEANEINISIYNWDRYDKKISEIFVRRGEKFMQELGYNLIFMPETEWIKDKEALNNLYVVLEENVKNIPIYPQDGSIKDMGEFVIIKIGPSLFDNK